MIFNKTEIEFAWNLDCTQTENKFQTFRLYRYLLTFWAFSPRAQNLNKTFLMSDAGESIKK